MQSSRSSRPPNLAGAKQTTKTMIKKIAPFVITGLAAVAEHHFLKHDDKGDDTSNVSRNAPSSEQERDDESSIRRLKRDVRVLKKELKRKGKEAVEVVLDSSSLSDKSSLEVVVGSERVKRGRGGGPEVREVYGSREHEVVRGFEQRNVPEIRIFPPPPPRVPSPPPPPFGIPPYIPIYEPPIMQDPPCAPDDTSRRHRRHRKHRDRNTSLPPRLHKDDPGLHATKVATIAGIMEGLHVAESKGDWLGPKGVRVGTAMAAAAGTSYVRGRGGDDNRPGDMVVDVGVGLLATRLLYGSKRRLENEDRTGSEGRRKRRWSHWF